MQVEQQASPFAGHKLLLDGQQRLTSLSAIVRGEPIKVRGRKRDIDILFNLEHPEGLSEFTEVEADEDPMTGSADSDGDSIDDDDDDGGEDELMERLNRLTFVVSSNRLLQLHQLGIGQQGLQEHQRQRNPQGCRRGVV